MDHIYKDDGDHNEENMKLKFEDFFVMNKNQKLLHKFIDDVIILGLGITGSGKSSMGNFLCNIFENVRKDDDSLLTNSERPRIGNGVISETTEPFEIAIHGANGTKISYIDAPGADDGKGEDADVI